MFEMQEVFTLKKISLIKDARKNSFAGSGI